ncbi:MAG: profilin [Thiofilum sp.]|uniref:profilin n=1 Tax=Thiofilum sp. TaxID=2212733 RepID=UPI0025CC8651|nr:profilin [Thiofilum sp.]MBK8452138.1 profilin [Thiofilum sp.]
MSDPITLHLQGYVDNLMGTKHFTAMAIVGRTMPTTIVASPGFPLDEVAIQSLLGLADTPNSTAVELMLSAEKTRYLLTTHHENGFILKRGGNGVVTVHTEKYWLIGLHDDKTKAEIVLNDMQRVASYLLRHGF